MNTDTNEIAPIATKEYVAVAMILIGLLVVASAIGITFSLGNQLNRIEKMRPCQQTLTR